VVKVGVANIVVTYSFCPIGWEDICRKLDKESYSIGYL